jgi:very-short-patch-repair endonuclease
VRLADLLELKPGISKPRRQSAFNRISSKHVDFAICDSKDLSILGLIELDDLTHKSVKRQARDSFLDTALNAAGIPILHIKAQSAYAVSEIRQQLLTHFDFLENKTEKDMSHQVVDLNDSNQIQPISDKIEAEETCTDCGAPMVKRQAKKGKFAGRYFMACSNFPKCRKIIPINRAVN